MAVLGTIRIKNSVTWLMICTLLLAIIIAGCSEEVSDSEKRQAVKALANYNTNQFLLNKLKENRVLFIGDFGHPVYLYKRTVTDLLNHWMDRIEAGVDTPRKLFVVVEWDSVEVARIQASDGSLDIDVWLDKSRPNYLNITTGDLQFLYHDIGAVLGRVRKYNARNLNDSVNLEVVGPERVLDIENWSFAKRDSFFVYERDKYSSSRVIDLLEENPDYRTIVFYGATHMLRGEQWKRPPTVNDKDYYLGHYLAERFEDDGGVYGVYQVVSKYFSGPNSFMMSPGETYAIDNDFLDENWFTYEFDGPYWTDIADGSVVYFEPAVVDCRLGAILSERIVDRFLEEIEQYEGSDNDYFRTSWQTADKRLRVISAVDANKSNALPYSEWARWYDSTDLNLVDDIASLRLWTRLIDRMEVADFETAHWYDSLISFSIGGQTYKNTTKTIEEKAETYREYLKLNGDVVIVENLVNLLMVGTDEEVEKALPVLRDSTGQDFATPWEWANWFRGSGLVYHPY